MREPADTPGRLCTLLADEVAELNADFGLPEEISVSVEPCGEANAFYDPELRRIILCTEHAEDLARIWRAAE